MKFRTEIEIAPLGTKIGYENRILALGSCFAEHIAGRLAQAKFRVTANPSGILFNPLSVAAALRSYAGESPVRHSELGFDGELWFHYGFHGSFSAPEADQALAAMNAARKSGAEALRAADRIVLTFGTAWVYEHDGAVVANCHRRPAAEFTRRRLGVDEIVTAFADLMAGPLGGREVILTVSPVRHLGDSLAGNTAVFGFAKQAIAQFKLGTDGTPDLLNICLDSSRRISEAYGPESVEAEDMYYRLDRDLADFLTFVFAQVKNGEVLVVFTSDHGTSPSYDAGREEADRFNARQFEVIVNGFLNVRYGMGNWVLEYEDKCLYLNHNLIYERGLNLADVQNEVAIFAMQFRGVSHALSATAMRTSYFGSGYARKMQNSFYPRRSGDVIMNLMPGWIEENDRCASSSGSMYGYDTQVPLVFYGFGAGPLRVKRRVDMTAVAPTVARVLEITEPAASEGEVLPEIIDF